MNGPVPRLFPVSVEVENPRLIVRSVALYGARVFPGYREQGVARLGGSRAVYGRNGEAFLIGVESRLAGARSCDPQNGIRIFGTIRVMYIHRHIRHKKTDHKKDDLS
jgi:hypothetical protein